MTTMTGSSGRNCRSSNQCGVLMTQGTMFQHHHELDCICSSLRHWHGISRHVLPSSQNDQKVTVLKTLCSYLLYFSCFYEILNIVLWKRSDVCHRQKHLAIHQMESIMEMKSLMSVHERQFVIAALSYWKKRPCLIG